MMSCKFVTNETLAKLGLAKGGYFDTFFAAHFKIIETRIEGVVRLVPLHGV